MLRTSFLATLLLGVVLTLLPACAPRPVDGPGEPDDATTPEALDAARARWHGAGLDDYRFVYGVSCFCPEDVRGPFTITVRDGAVAEVLYQGRALDPADPRHPTLDALFETLAEAFDRDAASVRARYDDGLGFPASAYIDYEALAADEELGWSVSDFTALED